RAGRSPGARPRARIDRRPTRSRPCRAGAAESARPGTSHYSRSEDRTPGVIRHSARTRVRAGDTRHRPARTAVSAGRQPQQSRFMALKVRWNRQATLAFTAEEMVEVPVEVNSSATGEVSTTGSV